MDCKTKRSLISVEISEFGVLPSPDTALKLASPTTFLHGGKATLQETAWIAGLAWLSAHHMLPCHVGHTLRVQVMYSLHVHFNQRTQLLSFLTYQLGSMLHKLRVKKIEVYLVLSETCECSNHEYRLNAYKKRRQSQ